MCGAICFSVTCFIVKGLRGSERWWTVSLLKKREMVCGDFDNKVRV